MAPCRVPEPWATPNHTLPLGVFAGLPFWDGDLTLLAAAPGLIKTSWLLRMIFEEASVHLPAAIGCYEHTPEELRYRLFLQVDAMTCGPHLPAPRTQGERKLANASGTVLLSLNSQEDTVRWLKGTLLHDYAFPVQGPSLVAVDYLNRVPVVGLTSMMGEEGRSGEAAASLRELARRHGPEVWLMRRMNSSASA